MQPREARSIVKHGTSLLFSILQIFIVVVVPTVHRDALAVALQFAAHVETGPRKQGCPQFQRVGP
jgi:hypothetical protein